MLLQEVGRAILGTIADGLADLGDLGVHDGLGGVAPGLTDVGGDMGDLGILEAGADVRHVAVVLRAVDFDLTGETGWIHTDVERAKQSTLGNTIAPGNMGIAILPTVAYEPDRDRNLQVRDASGLFEPTIARIEIRRSSFLRDYMYDFIRLVAPSWNREMIDQIIDRKSTRLNSSH